MNTDASLNDFNIDFSIKNCMVAIFSTIVAIVFAILLILIRELFE